MNFVFPPGVQICPTVKLKDAETLMAPIIAQHVITGIMYSSQLWVEKYQMSQSAVLLHQFMMIWNITHQKVFKIHVQMVLVEHQKLEQRKTHRLLETYFLSCHGLVELLVLLHLHSCLQHNSTHSMPWVRASVEMEQSRLCWWHTCWKHIIVHGCISHRCDCWTGAKGLGQNETGNNYYDDLLLKSETVHFACCKKHLDWSTNMAHFTSTAWAIWWWWTFQIVLVILPNVAYIQWWNWPTMSL